MTTTWHRALDQKARLFTLARVENRVFAYFPSTEGTEFESASGRSRRNHDDRPVRYWRDECSLDALDAWKAEYGIVGEGPATVVPGEFFPRMYRGPEGPLPNMDAYTGTVRVARSLFARLRDIFQVIEPHHEHDAVYGHELRQLLILACTEVESSWQAILKVNGYPDTTRSGKPRRWTTKDYVKLLEPMRLHSYRLSLAAHPSYGDIWPFQGWKADNATGSLPWYDAYNKTKHNRELELKRATLRNVIVALAAVHVMTVAQFGFGEVAMGQFHADAFNFLGSPRWWVDSYVRPLLPPDVPLTQGGLDAEWPHEWVQGACPF